MLKAVLFDCDGVLLDSEKIYLDSLSEYLKTLGKEVRSEELAYLVGSGIDIITEQLKRDFHLEEYSNEELIRGQRKIFNRRFYGEALKPMEGLVPLLGSLRQRGLLLAVVSSSGQDYVKYVLEQLNIGEYFKIYIGREGAGRSKPWPDLYQEALRRLDIKAEEAMVIEDSSNGILAGLRAGCYVAAYTGSQIKQDVSGADMVIGDYRELDVEALVGELVSE